MKSKTHVSINILLLQIDETLAEINDDINTMKPNDFESNVKFDELCIMKDSIISCKNKLKRFNNHSVLSKD